VSPSTSQSASPTASSDCYTNPNSDTHSKFNDVFVADTEQHGIAYAYSGPKHNSVTDPVCDTVTYNISNCNADSKPESPVHLVREHPHHSATPSHTCTTSMTVTPSATQSLSPSTTQSPSQTQTTTQTSSAFRFRAGFQLLRSHSVPNYDVTPPSAASLLGVDSLPIVISDSYPTLYATLWMNQCPEPNLHSIGNMTLACTVSLTDGRAAGVISMCFHQPVALTSQRPALPQQ